MPKGVALMRRRMAGQPVKPKKGWILLIRRCARAARGPACTRGTMVMSPVDSRIANLI